MKDLHLTRDELINLKKSMKDPQFKTLLSDYMLEVSDPNNKAEQDAYLRQLESEGELPKGMKLIQPKEFFCFTSKIAAEEDKKYLQKIYINVCTHPDADKARPGDIKDGKSPWHVPYFLGKQRYDQDKTEDKVIVCVIDIVFHDNIIGLCQKQLS